jgi:UDP-glucose 4-epimerase
MLVHLNPVSMLPQRTVVIGAGGFVGGAIVARLKQEGASVLSLTRKDANLLADDAAETLKALLKPNDAVVAAAARAPCKDMAMMIDNVVITKAILDAVTKVAVSHVVNISSDSVYPDEPLPLSERTPAAPATLHGAMHLTREIAFANAVRAPLAILRPSLLYGLKDPHNGYGPNRFRRQANAGEDIVLFGEGEERRDHVLIDDVAELTVRVLGRRSYGVLNVATGAVYSFRAIAEKAVTLAASKSSIKGTPRQGPMPHNGYRPFDTAAVQVAFPDFTFTPLLEGMSRVQRMIGDA